jgi:phospholipid/cholesterol/gamma-HCH transport system substrate-binding protein
MTLKRILWPLLIIAALIAVIGPARNLFGGHWDYSADLPDAAGIRAGDDVRVAGIDVGDVRSIAAKGDRVHVEFRLDRDVPLTVDTRTEVKLATLLGKRYLKLTPGRGQLLAEGKSVDLSHAYGSYTLERFWIEHGGDVGQFDMGALSDAVDVLASDLSGSPSANRDALDGLGDLSEIAQRRDAQVARLLTLTRSVTDEAVDQREQLVQLMTRGDKVFRMVEKRKEAIDLLLRDSRALVIQLTDMAERNQVPMTSAMKDLRVVLGTLVKHRDDLAKTLQLADPAMRLYVNSAGDGPWLGVNAPYVIFPDSYWCLVMKKDIGC